jgi:hypothetical protein
MSKSKKKPESEEEKNYLAILPIPNKMIFILRAKKNR